MFLVHRLICTHGVSVYDGTITYKQQGKNESETEVIHLGKTSVFYRCYSTVLHYSYVSPYESQTTVGVVVSSYVQNDNMSSTLRIE